MDGKTLAVGTIEMDGALDGALLLFENLLCFLELMAKGQLPPRSLLQMSHPVELILNGIKYKLLCTRKGQNTFKIELDSADSGAFVMTNVRAPLCQPLTEASQVDFTLVTQTSRNRLWLLEYHCQRWHNFISITVGGPDLTRDDVLDQIQTMPSYKKQVKGTKPRSSR